MILLLHPPEYDDSLADLVSPHTSVIFLAGPIQGTNDWQSQAVAYLNSYWKKEWGELFICNPRRSDTTWKYQFTEQVNWETTHLQLAANHGAILFWLANETIHDCSRAYAQTTRFELGEWLSRSSESVVLGIDSKFTGEKYIRHRLGSEKHIHQDLENTCKAAIEIARFNG